MATEYTSCEIREGFTVDEYVARARGFACAADWREYRDSSPERQCELREARAFGRDSRTDDNRDLLRVLEVLKVM